ncbi:hypothetical protein PGT21_009178 [Puccinia graminis f. sp. tritici]|uniref:Uncharacterized protein n=1 Tax=Puccinia graminis f. sp. tritici TaxID=56615 RepID=A0A5B0S6N0_PUCGR|nr:hypothetical protein PGT21_009178 [Puccinia graminis f. sp. tritici]KAA1133458.1 hypothetical protein PGTUg99_014477 [Puccinia graminis f. sp. tritici]
MTEANVMGAMIYGVLANRHTAVLGPPAPPNDRKPPELVVPNADIIPVELPLPNNGDIRNFLYSDYIKDEIRDFIRRKMIESRIIAYSRHLDDDGAAEPRSLLNMTQAHVTNLPVNIRQQHLPPGFPGGNNHARRSVLQLVRKLLKHDRVLLRNLLLKNVVDTSHAKVRAGGVPSLEGLYTSIHNTFLENSGVHAPRINWAMLPMRIKVRFAYLRLETAAHTLRRSPGHGSQWTPIDEQLALLTTKSMDYVRAWAEAIIAMDARIFGTGGVVFADVRHLLQLPTEQEIQDSITAHNMLPAADRAERPVMEDDEFNMDA